MKDPYSESIRSQIEATPKKRAKTPKISAGIAYNNVNHAANALAILLMMVVNRFLVNKCICIYSCQPKRSQFINASIMLLKITPSMGT